MASAVSLAGGGQPIGRHEFDPGVGEQRAESFPVRLGADPRLAAAGGFFDDDAQHGVCVEGLDGDQPCMAGVDLAEPGPDQFLVGGRGRRDEGDRPFTEVLGSAPP